MEEGPGPPELWGSLYNFFLCDRYIAGFAVGTARSCAKLKLRSAFGPAGRVRSVPLSQDGKPGTSGAVRTGAQRLAMTLPRPGTRMRGCGRGRSRVTLPTRLP